MEQCYVLKKNLFAKISSKLADTIDIPHLIENVGFQTLTCMNIRKFSSFKYFYKTINFCVPFLLFFILSFSLFNNVCFSQINVLNNGLAVMNTNDSVIINGNVVHQGNGSITNNGDFYVSGDWTNNNPSGNIFTSGTNGWLHLNGGIQNIGGNTTSHFNNLELEGTGIKQLNSVNTEIEDTLALNNHEFASGDNTILVMATGTGVVTRTNGFVSSTNDGGLSRNTQSTNTYFFPVGSSTGNGIFRPVDIIPNSTSPNTFKVRMANVDATLEGFDLTLKGSDLADINPNFYHRINRINGNSYADVTIYYDSIVDGDFTAMAQWANTNSWENLGAVSYTNNYGFTGLTKLGIYNFSTTPFALSSEVNASVFVPNVFSPNGDGSNDVLRVRGKGIEEIQFTIFNRWGEKIFETFDLNAGWDGTYKGEPMNLSVFVYVLKGKYKNGKSIDEKGNFTLMR
jgi:gliding motility-associated-like protein